MAGGQGRPFSGVAPAAGPPGVLPTPPDQNQQGAASRALVWSDLAATPGASQLVQAYAAQAQREAQA